ncbi:MAG TPA: hypothetical protein VFS35_01110 [Terrimicrobiaceae bacterium]|nr:hypothetical protein [Terrimicrobiaceae bacterium]
MKNLARIGVIAVVGIGAPAAAAEVRVIVSPLEQVVVAGEVPIFSVRVEAVRTSARVIRLNERDDLRVNYARLAITLAGSPVELPRFISDPGPIGANDYVVLDPGKSLSFLHRGEPFALSELRPGSYSARVTLHHELVGGAEIESNVVKLTVRAK